MIKRLTELLQFECVDGCVILTKGEVERIIKEYDDIMNAAVDLRAEIQSLQDDKRELESLKSWVEQLPFYTTEPPNTEASNTEASNE